MKNETKQVIDSYIAKSEEICERGAEVLSEEMLEFSAEFRDILSRYDTLTTDEIGAKVKEFKSKWKQDDEPAAID